MPFQLSFTFLVLTLALISRWDKTSYLLIISKPSHLGPQVNMLLLNTPATLVDSITLKQGKKLPTLMKRLKKDNEAIRKAVATQLSMSDAVQTGDLLRFYTPNGLKPVDSSTISYTKQMDQLKTD